MPTGARAQKPVSEAVETNVPARLLRHPANQLNKHHLLMSWRLMSLWNFFRGAPGPWARARSASSVLAYWRDQGRRGGAGQVALW